MEQVGVILYYCFMRRFLCTADVFFFSDVVFGVIHIMFNMIEDFLFDSMFSCLGEFHQVRDILVLVYPPYVLIYVIYIYT